MIRPLTTSDIPGLNQLPPKDWSMDYEAFLKQFMLSDFFHAFVLIQDEQIVGTGNVFIKKKVAWLANIIVNEKHRNQGLGFQITKFLLDFTKLKGCETQLLIATPLGEFVYKKLGFRKLTTYQCFDSTTALEYKPTNFIQKLKETDYKTVLEMDREINGEDRSHLFSKFFKNGHGYFQNSQLKGFYLPEFGRGLVLAKDHVAGLELLQLKHSEKGRRTLLPNENLTAISFLKQKGLIKGITSSKMILGLEIVWSPGLIYSYGSGYCG